ncbi:MAG: lactonase family protein [Oliverpabstia sp.]
MDKNCMVYVGTYAEKEQIGIHGLNIKRMSDGKIELKETAGGSGVSNPSYLTASADGRFLYAVMEDMTYDGKIGGGVAALEIEESSLKLMNTRGTDGTLPCHILLDEQRGYIFTANYMGGSISMFHLENDGSIGEMCDFHQLKGSGPNKERQEKSHVHFLGFTSDKNGIWAVDLGDDKVKYYDIDERNSKLIAREERDIVMPGGVGPRHFVQNIHKKEIMYIVCELSSEIYVVECGESGNRIIQSISTLPDGVIDSTCAAIHISEDNRFIYASNRGDDSIAVYKIKEDYTLELVEIAKTNGRTPRDFCLIQGLAICANQDSNSITIFKIDETTGKLIDMYYNYSCKSPVCLIAAN